MPYFSQFFRKVLIENLFQTMSILLSVCAFSAFLSSVICMDSPGSSPPTPPGEPQVFIPRLGATDCLFWDHNKLFWIDITEHQLCAWHQENENIYCATLAMHRVYFAAPVQGHPNVFVVGDRQFIYMVHWNTGAHVLHPYMTPLRHANEGIVGNRLNHGTVDPQGRLWVGTVNDIPQNFALPMGNVHSVDVARAVRTHIFGARWSSGIVWDYFSNPRKCYHVDSLTFEVVSYTYYQGNLFDKHVIMHLPTREVYGVPGDLAIDTRGHLWVPMFGTGLVVEINPWTETIGRIIDINAYRVAGCTFGGPEMDILYVSTKGYGTENPNDERPYDDFAGGSIFEIRSLGVTGRPTYRYVWSGLYG